MPVVVDLANAETDVEDVRKITERNTTEEYRDAVYTMFLYTCGAGDHPDYEALETIVEFGLENGYVSDYDERMSELQQEYEEIREEMDDYNSPKGEQKVSSLQAIVEYILFGEDKEKAVRAKEISTSNGWDLNFIIPVF
jgi:hypothetical protein